MRNWNVVVSVREPGFRQAWAFLQDFGTVGKTDYYNVLTLQVADADAFPDALQGALEREPHLRDLLGHAMPVVRTFVFQDAGEFERKACEAAAVWIPTLAGHSFHVRMHRRGFRHRLSSQDEEQFLDHWLAEAVRATGETSRITFEDPDYILALETVGQDAGLSLWDREQRRRYAFLGLS
jgi:tRNA(Ser,Leu) C12 N-acetylase TAN1